ncbi:hypothetical protein [Herminiimonas contaminans]|uniref:Uncharacterized protein n=1 Tax=Herminiimonas contaminans TaxID=1111140 RepID=A0ABS0EYC1_9BURK|nr:hypothetical protein [Herminiimonas contaminans]MBF8179795.1 hypothetical protein [Herminiimonas contaminans]
MNQSLCPYTTKLLSETTNVNDEHILPIGLGAPQSFYVPATEEENLRLNTLIDAPAINDPLLRFIAMAAGVVSRSGVVKTKLKGTLSEGGETVAAVFSTANVDLKFVKPIDIDSTSGQILGIRGFGDQAATQAEQIKKDHAKKGKLIEIGDIESRPSPWIKFDFEGDMHVIRAEIIKTAYLMSVRVFGDDAIRGRSGDIFRAAMVACNADKIRETGILGGLSNDLPPPFNNVVERNEHLIASVNIGPQILTVVQLFGTFSAFFLTPSTDFSCEPGTGEIVKINAATATMEKKTLVDLANQLAAEGRFHGIF